MANAHSFAATHSDSGRARNGDAGSGSIIRRASNEPSDTAKTEGGDATRNVGRPAGRVLPKEGGARELGAWAYTFRMDLLARITHDQAVMGGRPCIRGMRVTVGMIMGLLAAGRTQEEILQAYPYLEKDDIQAALTYAAWRTQEEELPLT